MQRLGTIRSLVCLSISACCGSACFPAHEASWHKEALPKKSLSANVTPNQKSSHMAYQAWLRREDKQSLQQAIALWEQSARQSPQDEQIQVNLARAYFFLAEEFYNKQGAEALMQATYQKGIAAGEKAMLAHSADFASQVKQGVPVEQAVQSIGISGQAAIYWYAVNFAKFSLAKGISSALYYKDRIFRLMQYISALDEHFFHAATHRYFGAFFAKAPSFFGGDMQLAKQHFERALELDDGFFATKVLYAAYYATSVSDRNLFRKLLNEVIEGDPSSLPGLIPEQHMEQKRAKRLLAQIDELF